jgi:hypothetical protein
MDIVSEKDLAVGTCSDAMALIVHRSLYAILKAKEAD